MVATAHIPLLGIFAGTGGATGLFRSCNGYDDAEVIVNVTTLTGTSPSATVILEGFAEYASQFAGSTQVYTVFTFTAITIAGSALIKLSDSLDPLLPRNIRARVTTGGTITNLTMSVEIQLKARSSN